MMIFEAFGISDNVMTAFLLIGFLSYEGSYWPLWGEYWRRYTPCWWAGTPIIGDSAARSIPDATSTPVIKHKSVTFSSHSPKAALARFARTIFA